MDQKEDLTNVQQVIHPTNLLNNTFKVFDALPLKQKDALIAQYKRKQEDFVTAWLDWPLGNQWHCMSPYIQSPKELKALHFLT